MGMAKQEQLEIESRGWYEPDGHVCDECVEDEFLKNIIRLNANQRECDYCGRRTRSHCAAPVATIMEPIGNTVFYYYNDPASACVPYEGGYLFDPEDTEDVLMSIGLECHEKLFEDISKAFVPNGWVESAGGHWASSHQSDILNDSWSNFVEVVKHEVRFFFSRIPTSSDSGSQEYSPQQLLSVMSHLIQELGLVNTISMGTSLYRVRNRDEGSDWALNQEQMGPPPSDRAAAGRMNPAGISYLYLAFELETALAEVLDGPPCGAAIAQFGAQREMFVLNLTSLPQLPSIFDNSDREQREGLMFLKQFVVEISKPVRKDGREHVEYVPSQVVSEYFALVFRTNGQPLDGIVYPSAVRPGGKNLVLFPNKRGYERNFEQVVFQSAQEQAFADWAELSAAICR